MPLVVVALFTLYHVALLIVALWNRKFRLALLCLLIASLLLFLPLKITFVFYNIFVQIFLIIMSIFILKKWWNTCDLILYHKTHFILLPIVGLNVIILFMDNTFIFKIANSPEKFTSGISMVTWNNFQGKILNDTISMNDSVRYATSRIEADIWYRINIVYNYPQVVTFSYMEPQKSYTRSYDLNLLEHEKTHLRIAEIYSRRISLLNNNWPTHTNPLTDSIGSIMQSYNNAQKKFDKATMHGMIKNEELAWEKAMVELLK